MSKTHATGDDIEYTTTPLNFGTTLDYSTPVEEYKPPFGKKGGRPHDVEQMALGPLDPSNAPLALSGDNPRGPIPTSGGTKPVVPGDGRHPNQDLLDRI